MLDATLIVLRSCRSMSEFATCAGVLAVQGCAANAAAVARVTNGTWSPWLQSGELTLLESVVSVRPVSLDGSPGVEQQVISSGVTCVEDLPSETLGCQVVVAAIPGRDAVGGLLHVVGYDLDTKIVESYACALGSMMKLFGLKQRAAEQRDLLDRIRHGLADTGGRPIELCDAGFDPHGLHVAAEKPELSATVLRNSLTARQRDVLDLMMGGLSNAEIADRLVIGMPTVKSHVRAVLRAVGAVNRADAVTRFARGRTPRSSGETQNME